MPSRTNYAKAVLMLRPGATVFRAKPADYAATIGGYSDPGSRPAPTEAECDTEWAAHLGRRQAQHDVENQHTANLKSIAAGSGPAAQIAQFLIWKHGL